MVIFYFELFPLFKTILASKLYLYFYTTNFTKKTITQYKATAFTSLTDVKVMESPTYYIYVSDYDGILAQYSQSGTYIRYRAIDCFYLATIDGGNLYSTTRLNGNQMNIFSPTIGIVSQPLIASTTYVYDQFAIRYDPNTKFLYQADRSTQFINALDTNLVRLALKSIDTSLIQAKYDTRCVAFYKAGTTNLIYIGFRNGQIFVVDLTTKAVQNVMNTVCPTGDAVDIYIHQSGGYMVLSCYYADVLKFYTTDGTTHTNTGKTINMATPYGMDFDSYGRFMVVSRLDNTVYMYTPRDYPI